VEAGAEAAGPPPQQQTGKPAPPAKHADDLSKATGEVVVTPTKSPKSFELGFDFVETPLPHLPPHSYRRFQSVHRGHWEPGRRCGWPHGTLGCPVCQAFFSVVPNSSNRPNGGDWGKSFLGSASSEIVPLRPGEVPPPSSSDIVPEAPTHIAEASPTKTPKDLLVCTYLAKASRAAVFIMAPSDPRTAGKKFPVLCRKCNCIIDCLNRKGVQAIKRHEGTKKHGGGCDDTMQVCRGALLTGETFQQHLLGRLHSSVFKFAPYSSEKNNWTLIQELSSDPRQTGAVRVQARSCNLDPAYPKKGQSLCEECLVVMRNRSVARAAANFAMWSDELCYVRLLREGDAEAAEGLARDLSSRDYVMQGLGEEIFRVICGGLAEVTAHVHLKMSAVPTVLQSSAYRTLLGHVRLLCRRARDTPEERAQKALADSLATEVSLGQLSSRDVRAGAALASGKLQGLHGWVGSRLMLEGFRSYFVLSLGLYLNV